MSAYQYQAAAIFATILAMNSMACRVFRLLRELNADEGTIHLDQISTIHFGQNPLRSAAAYGLPVDHGDVRY